MAGLPHGSFSGKPKDSFREFRAWDAGAPALGCEGANDPEDGGGPLSCLAGALTEGREGTGSSDEKSVAFDAIDVGLATASHGY